MTVRDGVAHPLPVQDDGFDAAVTSLVLCTVPDPAYAVDELRRVVRPGGEVRFFEHVRSSRPRKARLQDALDDTGIWPFFVGGCRTGRDTLGAFERAGFTIARARRVDVGPAANPANPHVVGAAVAPA